MACNQSKIINSLRHSLFTTSKIFKLDINAQHLLYNFILKKFEPNGSGSDEFV